MHGYLKVDLNSSGVLLNQLKARRTKLSEKNQTIRSALMLKEIFFKRFKHIFEIFFNFLFKTKFEFLAFDLWPKVYLYEL